MPVNGILLCMTESLKTFVKNWIKESGLWEGPLIEFNLHLNFCRKATITNEWFHKNQL